MQKNKILDNNFRTKKSLQSIHFAGFHFFYSDPGGVRTPNPQSRNLIFYPVELRGHDLKFQFFKFQILILNLEFGIFLLSFQFEIWNFQYWNLLRK